MKNIVIVGLVFWFAMAGFAYAVFTGHHLVPFSGSATDGAQASISSTTTPSNTSLATVNDCAQPTSKHMVLLWAGLLVVFAGIAFTQRMRINSLKQTIEARDERNDNERRIGSISGSIRKKGEQTSILRSVTDNARQEQVIDRSKEREEHELQRRQLNAEIRRLNERNNELEQQKAKLTKANVLLKQQNEVLEDEVVKQNCAIQRQAMHIVSLEEQLTGSKHELESLNDRLEIEKEKVNLLEKELTQEQEKSTRLEENLENSVKETERVSVSLQQKVETLEKKAALYDFIAERARLVKAAGNNGEIKHSHLPKLRLEESTEGEVIILDDMGRHYIPTINREGSKTTVRCECGRAAGELNSKRGKKTILEHFQKCVLKLLPHFRQAA